MQYSSSRYSRAIRSIPRRTLLSYLVVLALTFWIYVKFFKYTETKPPFPFPSKFTPYDQEHPVLIAHVRQHYITEPSKYPYTFLDYPTTNITQMLWPMLKEIVGVCKKGFFAEAGAYNGVDNSNTVWLEVVHGWNGLLVECHPELLPILHSRQRKAYIADACLSKYPYPAKAELTSPVGWLIGSSSMGSGKNLFPDYMTTFTKFQVQTIPLYTLLAAISVTTVDFISLDVQSMEYDVLQYFPFHLILVKVCVIRVEHLSTEQKVGLNNLMKQKGYTGPTYYVSDNSDLDRVFVHTSIY